MRIGIIGTGMLGSAVARRFAERGHEVLAYNRTPESAAALGRAGVRIMETPRELAAASELVITCVTDAGAVRGVLFGPDGAAAGAQQGTVIADMSTIGPEDSRSIASGVREECGAAMIGIPVMGGPDAALAGGLVVISDGDEGVCEAHRGVLSDIADTIHYAGPNGAAHTVKLAMNLQISMLALSISEGIEIARCGGIDPELFLGVLNSTYFATGMSRKKAHRMARGQYAPTFLLRNLKKDLDLIAEFAGSHGAGLVGAEAARGAYAEAVAAGLGDLAYTGIHRHIEGLRKG